MTGVYFLTILSFLCIVVLSQGQDRERTRLRLSNYVDPPSLCDNCWCIPSSDQKCPKRVPKYNFRPKDIQFFMGLELDVSASSSNPCNPRNPARNWIPVWPQPIFIGECPIPAYSEDAVCAFLYDYSDISTDTTSEVNFEKQATCPSTYSLVTFNSYKEAKMTPGAVVTHTGWCGMCSTAKDLAVYMEKPDLTGPVTECLRKGEIAEILPCMLTIGFSLGCALVYLEDGLITNFYNQNECGNTCALYGAELPNGPPPHCTLNPCLQCNERASAAAGNAGELPSDFFTTYAGRTRRNSGLLSNVVRACDSISHVKQKTCCPIISRM